MRGEQCSCDCHQNDNNCRTCIATCTRRGIILLNPRKNVEYIE